MYKCNECECDIDQHEHYTNDGLCDDCLEASPMELAAINVYRINNFMLDAKYVSTGTDVYDNIYNEEASKSNLIEQILRGTAW